jgi:hypothetical protein
MREREMYLGDGAYATLRDDDVVVWCFGLGDNGRHFVHLERSAVQGLVDFLRLAGWRIK